MSVINFSCTKCGGCCRNLSIPLTLDEAIAWLEDSGNLAIFCEASPWPSEPPPDDLRAAHRKKQSFAASCGASRARITAILVAVISGACKNLNEDMTCRIYERRPLVCRIYPAEINPFIPLITAQKCCPPESWVSGSALLSDGKIVDPHLQSLIEKSRRIAGDDALKKDLLCRELNINVAAVIDEGFVAHEPDRNTLLCALRNSRNTDPVTLPEDSPWRLYTRNPDTFNSLQAKGLETIFEKRPEDPFTFLHTPRPDFQSVMMPQPVLPTDSCFDTLSAADSSPQPSAHN